MEDRQQVKPGISGRIVIRELTMPSHAGEFEFGFSLVFCQCKWQFEISWYGAIGGGQSGYSYIDLPEEIWDQPPYEALEKLVNTEAKLDPHIYGRGTCRDWEKLERLFEKKKEGRK